MPNYTDFNRLELDTEYNLWANNPITRTVDAGQIGNSVRAEGYTYWNPLQTDTNFEVGKKYPIVKIVQLDDHSTNISVVSNLEVTQVSPAGNVTISINPLGAISSTSSINDIISYATNTIGMYPSIDKLQDPDYLAYYNTMLQNAVNQYKDTGISVSNDLVATYYDVKDKSIKLWDTLIEFLYDETNRYYHNGNLREKGLSPKTKPTTAYYTLNPVPFNVGNVVDLLMRMDSLALSIASSVYPQYTGWKPHPLYNYETLSKWISDAIAYDPSLFNGYRDFFTMHTNAGGSKLSYLSYPTYSCGFVIVLDLYNVDYNRFSGTESVYAYKKSPGKRVMIRMRSHYDSTTKETIYDGAYAFGYDLARIDSDYSYQASYKWGQFYQISKINVSGVTLEGTTTTFSGSYTTSIRPDWVINDYPPSGRGYNVDFPENPDLKINTKPVDPDGYPDVVVEIPGDDPQPIPSPKEIRDTWKIPVPPDPERKPVGPIDPYQPTSTKGLFTVYYTGDDELNAVKKVLWNPSLITTIKEMFSDNPINAIVDLHALYAQPVENVNYNTVQNVYLYTVDCGDDSASNVINNNIIELSYGYKPITRKFNDYRDFSPYTSIDLYLPFVGFVKLPVDPFVGDNGGYIGVKYNVDIVTGNCVALVMSSVEGVAQCVATYEGNCSYSLPIYGVDRTSLAKSTVGAVGNILTGNFGAAVSRVATTGQSIEKSGSISGNHGALSYKHPFFIINRCVDADTDYNDIYGYTTNTRGSLGSFSGYVRVNDCHVDKIGCTQEEQQMIYDLLKDGVIV